MKYKCNKCLETYDATPDRFRCDCGSALWLDFEGRLTREDIDRNDFSLWRYSKAYPVKKKDVKITFGEGMTPLTRITFSGADILVKQDSLMPTGSFKDRGVAMVTNYMHSQGVTHFAEDSSGNGGSAFAGFCALGGIKVQIYVPAGTSAGKVAQMKVYGAELVEVEGTRADVANAAMNRESGGVYVGHNWHPFFVEGVKSVAYELWEQNGFKAPDNVVCVAGNGSMVIGLYLGFSELVASGELMNLPRIFAVQSEGCDPLYRDFAGESMDFEPTPSVAEGIRIVRSTRHEEVLDFVRKSEGAVLRVLEDDIIRAVFEAGQKGLFIEPTSATGFAGVKQLVEQGIISPRETTAVIVSGNGLKATGKIMEMMEAGGRLKE